MDRIEKPFHGSYNIIPLSRIKREYFLDDICAKGTVQYENIALTIQSLYFYQDLLNNNKLTRDLEANICRVVLIMSYSIIDAIVISVGYKIQGACLNCRHECSNKCDTIFKNEERKNEEKAFTNADKFLKKIGIIKLSKYYKNFYDNYRKIRNNIHLTKVEKLPFNQNEIYTPEYCNQAIDFFQNFIDMIHNNYLIYITKNHCYIEE